nr:hypothetical protein [uncultured Flavobacterium sp.]
MNQKKRIKKLEAKVSSLLEIVQKGSLTLTDVDNPNVKVVFSIKSGVFSTDKITTTINTDNIINNQNQ